MARKKNTQQLNNLAPLNFNPILETQTDINKNDDEKGYFIAYSGPIVHELATVGKHTKMVERKLATDNATAYFKTASGKATVKIDNFMGSVANILSTSTKKFLDFCCVKFAENTNYKSGNVDTFLTFSLTEYIQALGKDPKDKNARKDIKRKVFKDIENLGDISIIIEQPVKGEEKNKALRKLVQEGDVYQGTISILFTDFFANYLTNKYILPLPKSLFAIKDTNPILYDLGRKLSLHYTMQNNILAGSNNILKVKTILNAIPNIPKFEDITDGHWRRRISKVLQDSLDELEEKGIITWYFCHANHKPLTDEELIINSYHELEQRYIAFEVLECEQYVKEVQNNPKIKRKKQTKKVKESNQHDN